MPGLVQGTRNTEINKTAKNAAYILLRERETINQISKIQSRIQSGKCHGGGVGRGEEAGEKGGMGKKGYSFREMGQN